MDVFRIAAEKTLGRLAARIRTMSPGKIQNRQPTVMRVLRLPSESQVGNNRRFFLVARLAIHLTTYAAQWVDGASSRSV